MLRIPNCLKEAMVISLIAALTPGLWAQPPGGADALRSLSELQPTETARQAMRGDRVSPGKRTDAPPTAPAQGSCPWDFDDSGDVGVNDLLMLLGNWGPCPGGGHPECNANAGDCCVPNGTPGCNNEDCCNLICDIDPFCCDAEWDSICAGEAAGICGIC